MTTPCTQEEKIKRLVEDVENHRDWRKETSSQLTNIEVALATLNERLKSFDKVLEDNKNTRVMLITLAGSWLMSVFAVTFFLGGMSKQVDINTGRWDKLLTEPDHKAIQ